MDWIDKNFKNLDVEDIEQEINEIFKDVPSDMEKDILSDKIDRAFTITKWVNRLAWVVGLWGLFLPRPYTLVIMLNALIIIVSLSLVFIFKGVIDFDEKRNSVKPSVASSLIFPALILTLRGMMDYYIVYSLKFFIILGILSITLSVLVMITTKEYKKSKGIVFFLPIILFVWIYGLTIHSNVMLDKSAPTQFTSQVLQKETRENRGTDYYFIISPWGPKEKEYEMEVWKEIYESTKINDKIEFYLYKGFWGLKWYQIGR